MAEREYILGSHNSWSFLRPRHWWHRPFAFTARCQSADISQQYFDYGVRCFDLRIRAGKDGSPIVAHGMVEYDITDGRIMDYLAFMDHRGDCCVRLVHEVRTRRQYTMYRVYKFKLFCDRVTRLFPNVRFWCGRNLYNWQVDYDFGDDPTCEEAYSSVKKPVLLDDWFPYLYARMRNRNVIKKGTDKDILLMDFVNIGKVKT